MKEWKTLVISLQRSKKKSRIKRSAKSKYRKRINNLPFQISTETVISVKNGAVVNELLVHATALFYYSFTFSSKYQHFNRIRMLLHRLQEANAGTQVFRLRLSGLHGHGNLLRPQNCTEEEKSWKVWKIRTHALAATSEDFFKLQEFTLFPSQTIHFHHEPNSDFQAFLKSIR